ncbi:MAG: SLC13 family permease [Thermoprotei archaeon]
MEEFEVTKVGSKRDFLIFFVINVIDFLVLYYILQNITQAIATTIFMATVIGTLMFWRFRLAIAFLGIALLLITRTLDLEHMIQFMSIDVITFLISMMIVVRVAEEEGFFDWFLYKIMKYTGNDPRKVLIVIMSISTLMAALVDEVTSILFITAIIFRYTEKYKIPVVSFVIPAVLATNIGSSATLLGNPIGILIALRAGLTFEDFIFHATPVALLALISIIPISLLWYRKDLKIPQEIVGSISNEEEHFNMNRVKRGGILMISTILLIALHYRIELLLGLEKNVFLIVAAMTGAFVALIWKRDHAREVVEKGVDWWTLTFFMFLFAKAGTLAYTGVTDKMAKAMATFSGNSLFVTVSIILWVSGFGSSVLDNVVLVAAFIPVVKELEQYIGGSSLWWALLFGGTYGGNITMVGSTANIVALGLLEKKINYHMTFFKWFWIGLLGGIIPMLVANAILFLYH